MKRMNWVILGVLLVGLTAQPAWAARLRIHELAESQQYGQKAGGMLGRGALNGLTCFVDPLVNVVNETKAGPPLVGTLTGVAKGLGCGVLRLGSGAIDVVTFWVPGFNGFPVSDSYQNCLATSEEPSAAMTMPSHEAASAVGAQPSAPASTLQTPSVEPSATESEQPVKHQRKWKK